MAGWMLAILTVLLSAVSAIGSDCTIVQFTATWCEPCQQVAPSLERLAREGWAIRTVDTDQEPQLAQQFRIQNLPTLVIVSGGREVDRIVGAASYATILGRVERVAARGESTTSPATQPVQPTGPIVRGQSPGVGAFPMLASQATQALAAQGMSNVLAANSPTAEASQPGAESAVPPATTQNISMSAARTPLTLEQAIARAAEATVRIRVDEGNTTAFGTGTVIDVHGQEALVLTCGHLFRNMTPGSQLTVDLFPAGSEPLTLPAQLIDFQAEGEDIGLISFHTPIAIDAVEVFPRNQKPTVGEDAFSFGCDHGADPTRRDTKVKHIDRYIGAANIEIYGAPAVGRSGGGLFDVQGRLIGVCNAADATDDEGIYAAADVVYTQIERLGLTHLFDEQRAANAEVQLASAPSNFSSQPAPTTQSTFAQPAGYTQAAPNAGPASGTRELQWPDEGEIQQALALGDSSGVEPSGDVAGMPSQLICIVRDASGRDRVVTINSPPPQLVHSIEQYAQPQ